LDVDPAVKGAVVSPFVLVRSGETVTHSPALRVGKTLLSTDQAGGKRQRSTILT
jgi:hypothetical protein